MLMRKQMHRKEKTNQTYWGAKSAQTSNKSHEHIPKKDNLCGIWKPNDYSEMFNLAAQNMGLISHPKIPLAMKNTQISEKINFQKPLECF